ncbi:MAG TPA: DoxX family protein [Phycisphaerae bacterium]|nr:DoxX family protein [Phycisphaerae bacterium]
MSMSSKTSSGKFWVLRKPHELLILVGTMLQPVVLLIVRILMGWEFYETGHGKLTHISVAIENFRGWNVPFPVFNAWFVSGLECFGGLLLLVGLLSRPIALLLAIDMIVAYLAVPDDRVTFFHAFSDPDSFTSAAPFLFLLASVLVLCFGPGIFSVDRLLQWLFLKKKAVSSTANKT